MESVNPNEKPAKPTEDSDSSFTRSAGSQKTCSVSIPDPTPGELHGPKEGVDIFGYVIGGVAAVVAAPVVLGAVGFTGAGIAAGSVAAKMMSAAAIANGGGVAAGSLVATLQSAGAAGLSASSNALLGAAGSAMGGWLCGSDD
ncbi:interferon alpha-inducible protein 27-like protein 2A isoform X2 [Talpa occidentalis]|uniref:interferon alpha-inducible protein 27-like protein 2A isoform X2 n=1 Tax=Talpa occidentalis TaxID=50954 RepID=UPI0023F7FE35|nr:interferon alpha-inducible protein 27-like protein 2A isoform X2 [Talpa occidentalis]